jgi:hypothetical protein
MSAMPAYETLALWDLHTHGLIADENGRTTRAWLARMIGSDITSLPAAFANVISKLKKNGRIDCVMDGGRYTSIRLRTPLTQDEVTGLKADAIKRARQRIAADLGIPLASSAPNLKQALAQMPELEAEETRQPSTATDLASTLVEQLADLAKQTAQLTDENAQLTDDKAGLTAERDEALQRASDALQELDKVRVILQAGLPGPKS